MKNHKKNLNIKKNKLEFKITPEQIEKIRPYVKDIDKVLLQGYDRFSVVLDEAIEANLDRNYKHTETSKMLEEIYQTIRKDYIATLPKDDKIHSIDDHIPTKEELLESLIDIPKEELEKAWNIVNERAQKEGFKIKPLQEHIDEIENYKKTRKLHSENS